MKDEERRGIAGRTYAALDLGTNNCRLLIARPEGEGFKVVDAFSRIVRLGEGLSSSGALNAAAMDRTLWALGVCAEKLRRRDVDRMRAVATQACRSATNGQSFLDRVARETGLAFEVIEGEEEARLSVAGCVNLLDGRDYDAALVLDVGGGSTELSWLDLRRVGPEGRGRLQAWCSLPLGVVTLAERFPERAGDAHAWFRTMVDAVRAELDGVAEETGLRRVFEAGRGHLIGTSGAITSLAGLHLELPKYRRELVDGLWMTPDDCEAVTQRLLTLDVRGRAAEPCIGPDRADLVLAGAAILRAVQELWPSPRLRVADRGLREGVLLTMMAEDRKVRGAAPAPVRA